MINLLGPADRVGAYQLVNAAAVDEHANVFVHLYWKQPSKPNRKLGHATIVWESIDEVLAIYENVTSLLRLVPAHD